MFGWGKKAKPDADAGMQEAGSHLQGAYRLHRPDDVARSTLLATQAFPAYTGQISCFGADWLGRQFATDEGRILDGKPLVLLLEPGTGKALEIPLDRAAFHERELVEEPDAAVAYSFFQQWLAAGGSRPHYDQCIGYRRPLFLGGADELTNLEISDFDVYWTISAQLLAQIRAG